MIERSDSYFTDPITEPARFPFLKRLAAAVAVVLVLAVAAAFAVPALLPASIVRDLVAAAVSEVAGRPARVDGEVSLRLLPRLAVEAGDIAVGAPAAPVLTIRRAAIELDTLAMLASRLEVRRLHLVAPALDLTAAADDGTGTAAPPWDRLRGLAIADLEIEAGRVRYPSPFGRGAVTVTGIAAAGGGDEDGDLAIGGTFGAGAAAGRLDAVLRDLPAFTGGTAVPFRAALEAGDDSLRFEGTLARRQRFAADGRLTARLADPARLAAWTGLGPAAWDGLALGVDTRLVMTGADVELSELALVLGGLRLTGDLAVAGRGAGRRVSGRLSAETLHLAPLRAAAFGRGGGGLLAVLPRVFPAGGEVALNWQRLQDGAVRGGRGHLRLRRRDDGKLQASVDELALAGGQARFAVTLDQGEGMTALAAEARLIGVDVAQLALGGEAPGPVVSGRGNLELDLLTVGADPAQLAAALTGRGAFTISDGRLHDPVLLRAVTPETPAALPFQHLTGSLEIARGIVASEDLLLKAERVSVVAGGEVDLATGALAFRLDVLTPGDAADRHLRPLVVEGDVRHWQVRPAP